MLAGEDAILHVRSAPRQHGARTMGWSQIGKDALHLGGMSGEVAVALLYLDAVLPRDEALRARGRR